MLCFDVPEAPEELEVCSSCWSSGVRETLQRNPGDGDEMSPIIFVYKYRSSENKRCEL